MTALLDIRGLEVRFGAAAPTLAGIDLSIGAGETVALVGESGSGKSLTARSALRLLPRGAAMTAGSLSFTGTDVMGLRGQALDAFRGGQVAMLFQQPIAMLDPTATVGSQVEEAVRLHTDLDRAAARRRVIELFREVGIADPALRAGAYAHQLSGGMAQRVMLAAALAGDPRLLIADEPTTALDVTVQMQILRLLAREKAKRGLAMLLITHDLGIVRALAERTVVLYAGRVVEEGATASILRRPLHPYTRALVRAAGLGAGADGRLFALGSGEGIAAAGCRFLPRCEVARATGMAAVCGGREPELAAVGEDGQRVRCHAPLDLGRVPAGSAPERAGRNVLATESVALRLEAVSKHYRLGRHVIRAVDGVNLAVREGEVLGLVGESGCGKSTLARLLLRITEPTGGRITALGLSFDETDAAGLRAFRRQVQLVFQDPYGALDPRMTIGESLRAPMAQNGIGTLDSREAAVRAIMGEVGLDLALLDRRPGACSGGQLQRAVIARALLLGPRVLVCDEPTSALDASIRAQILNLLEDLRRDRGLTMLMISHDLRVMRRFADRVAVMYLGEIVEIADTATLFAAPAHPYTRMLLDAALPDADLLEGGAREYVRLEGTPSLPGEPPSPLAPPPGCRFAPRCSAAQPVCAEVHPDLRERQGGGMVRCHFPLVSDAAVRLPC